MSKPSTFRAWLKQRRIERGLTQEELGELVAYAGQTIRKIESGQRRPSLQLALRLAQALALPPDEQGHWMRAARAVAEPEDAAPAPQVLRPHPQIARHVTASRPLPASILTPKQISNISVSCSSVSKSSSCRAAGPLVLPCCALERG